MKLVAWSVAVLQTGLACAAPTDGIPAPLVRYTFDAPFGYVEPNAAGVDYPAFIPRNSVQQEAPERAAGIFGRAIRPGVRQNIKSTFPGGKEFTVSFWMQPRKLDAPDVFRVADVFRMGIPRNEAKLVVEIGGASLSGDIQTGQWTSVTLTSSGTEARLYLNGREAGSGMIELPVDPKDRELTFAGIASGHHLFAGLIDEVRIYDRALTADQVARISDQAQALQTVPPIADAGVDHTVYLLPGQGVDVPLDGRATEGGIIGFQWSVVAKPADAQVEIEAATSLNATARFSTPGVYVLQLTLDSERGASADRCRVVVFPPHPDREPGRLHPNPETPGAYITARTPVGDDKTPPPYDAEFVKKHFPVLEPDLSMDGFARERFRTPPPPYVHPRVFFNPEDLPSMRKRIRYTKAASSAYASVRRMYEMKSRGKGIPEDYIRKEEKKDQPGHTLVTDHDAAAGHCIGAFIALVEADGVLARQLIDRAVAMAPLQHEMLDGLEGWKKHYWQGAPHQVLGRYATSYVYDFLYPWMTPEEQDLLRGVISKATREMRSIGMFAVPQAVARSNWVCWVTGDLLANVLAIEGEDGFDPVVAGEAMNAMTKFANYGFLPDGSSYEGMGKNSITAQNLAAMAKRGQLAIASENIRNFYTRFQLNVMQPYGDHFIADDLWGHSRFPGRPPDAAVMKFAYPNDPAMDFVYRNVVKGEDYWTPLYKTTYGYNSALANCWFGEDWTGPADFNDHARQALEGQPLDAHFNHSNIATARSGWDKDAAFLYFLPRMLGGHNSPARGTFVFSALGRDWSLYPSGHNNQHSLQHSVITVNGKSVKANWARMAAFDSSPERMIAVADLRDVYTNRERRDLAMNDFRVERSPGPWNELPVWQLPDWQHGFRPTSAAPPAADSKPPALAAYRAVSLVRGERPYALIGDSVEMDGQPHNYRWQIVLPDDLEGCAEVRGQEVVVTDPKTGNRLLIRPLDSNVEFTVSVEPTRWAKGVVAYEAKAPAWNFAVALIPLRKGETQPLELPGLQARLSEMKGMLEPGQSASADTK